MQTCKTCLVITDELITRWKHAKYSNIHTARSNECKSVKTMALIQPVELQTAKLKCRLQSQLQLPVDRAVSASQSETQHIFIFHCTNSSVEDIKYAWINTALLTEYGTSYLLPNET
jgi:homoaconitase/3-isopropylmalate dehydratase large subunit